MDGSNGSAPRYWVGVASQEHVGWGLEGGFAQFCHGKQGPARRPVEWQAARPAEVRPLVPRLSFLAERSSWGQAFRCGTSALPWSWDFRTFWR